MFQVEEESFFLKHFGKKMKRKGQRGDGEREKKRWKENLQESDGRKKRKGRAVVAVHIGAGFHSEGKEKEFKRVMERACRAAMTILAPSPCCCSSSSSEEDGRKNMGDLNVEAAVAEAIAVLEDSPLTNAGTGSNLNLIGEVPRLSLYRKTLSLTFT